MSLSVHPSGRDRVLDPGTKAFVLGTHRAVPPEETWERIRPLLEGLGITRVADVTRLDRLGIPVYQAVRPTSRSLAVSQGKGATRDAARVSAAMESIELWHAERLDALPSLRMSVREMDYANPIAGRDLLWQEGAYRAFSATSLDWIEARPLAGGGGAWIPRAMIELDFRLPEGLAPLPFRVTSNGLASGNTDEEALLHGLCEVVERHSLDRAQRGDGKAALALDSVVVPYCREMIERIRAAGMKLAVWDITSELGIPTFYAELVADDLARLWIGSGCHPAADVALSRALTEAAQSRLTYIAGARDDIVGQTAWQLSTPHAAHRGFAEPAPEKSFDAVESLTAARLDADLEIVVERLAEAGYSAYAVDLGRPEIGLPVVRVFVPRLAESHHA